MGCMSKSSCSNIIFFYNSPIGNLEICLKKAQIYSLSRVSVQNRVHSKNTFVFHPRFSSLRKEKELTTKPFSCGTKGQKPDRYNSPFLIGQNLKTSELIYKLLLFLEAYFSKDEIHTHHFSLFSRGTAFQKKVWRHLRKIPYGHTRSYGEVANMMDAPGAARAVGLACAKNPWLILVPCHRVVAQKGLGGFALGLSKKKWLLNHEKKLYQSGLKIPKGPSAGGKNRKVTEK